MAKKKSSSKKSTKTRRRKVKKTKKYIYAMGRRKTAIATVRLYEGKGDDKINGKDVEKIYNKPRDKKILNLPFKVSETVGKFYFTAKIYSGGRSGQLDALKLALARALVKYNEDLKKVLKQEKLLTVDSRVKERKKPGLKKARKKEQFSKR